MINKLDSMAEICDGTIYFPPFRSMKKMKNGFFEERTIWGISRTEDSDDSDIEIKYSAKANGNENIIRSDKWSDILTGDLLSIFDNASSAIEYYDEAKRGEFFNKKLDQDIKFFSRLEDTIKTRLVSELLAAVQLNDGVISITEKNSDKEYINGIFARPISITTENSEEGKTVMMNLNPDAAGAGKSTMQISPFSMTVPELLNSLEMVRSSTLKTGKFPTLL